MKKSIMLSVIVWVFVVASIPLNAEASYWCTHRSGGFRCGFWECVSYFIYDANDSTNCSGMVRPLVNTDYLPEILPENAFLAEIEQVVGPSDMKDLAIKVVNDAFKLKRSTEAIRASCEMRAKRVNMIKENDLKSGVTSYLETMGKGTLEIVNKTRPVQVMVDDKTIDAVEYTNGSAPTLTEQWRNNDPEYTNKVVFAMDEVRKTLEKASAVLVPFEPGTTDTCNRVAAFLEGQQQFQRTLGVLADTLILHEDDEGLPERRWRLVSP